MNIIDIKKIRVESKTKVKNSVSRMIFVAVSVLLQMFWIIGIVNWAGLYSQYFSILVSVAAVIAVLAIYSRDMNAALRMPWIILILIFPVMGIVLYFLCGHSGAAFRMKKRIKKVSAEFERLLDQDKNIETQLRTEDRAVANQMAYLWKSGKYPVYDHTVTRFYPEAKLGLEAQLEAMRKAERFIFMEYHAIEDAQAFAPLKEILFAKARAGVEVRILYDDMGSVWFINREFQQEMEQNGIECRVFNPLIPLFNVFMNNRDHRKIMIIDGKTAFTGGYNLANEYFGVTHPYGYWKDSGIRVEGDAVRNFTVMFLQMWNVIRKTDIVYKRYFCPPGIESENDGYVAPYADNPLGNERVGENVYLNLIGAAKRYIYFTTPYLIISDEMNRALCLAAKRGVDVRIVTPGVPDKKIVYRMTRSYYRRLVSSGVKIYEYTPGFCHAKQCICDDELAAVGTVNMDYRSLYLHFENGVLLYRCRAIREIYMDFVRIFGESEDVTENYRNNKRSVSMLDSLLRILAPLF